MTIQTNDEELERQKFEDWFNSKFLERIKSYPRMEQIRYKNIARLPGWPAASRSSP